MKHFLQMVERHKELVDLGIKMIGVILTFVGALLLIAKYFNDRKEARLTTELDLRRQAYFDFFSALPSQLIALGELFGDRDAIIPSPEAYQALTRLHLLASHDALESLIKHNAMYHEGVLELVALKRRARQFQAIVDGGDERMVEKVANTWDAFRQRFRKLIADLNAHYRELVIFARREIGLRGGEREITAAMERDAKLALAKLDQNFGQST